MAGPKIVPLRGKFKEPGAMLARIQEDAEHMESFFIAIRMKDGKVVPAHFKCTLEFMSFVGAYCLREAVHPDMEEQWRG